MNESVVTWPRVSTVDAGYLMTTVEYIVDAKFARYDADDDTYGHVSASSAVIES